MRVAIMLMFVIVMATYTYQGRVEATEISENEMKKYIEENAFGFYHVINGTVNGSANYGSCTDGTGYQAYSVDGSLSRAITFHYVGSNPPCLNLNFTGSASSSANAQLGSIAGMASNSITSE